MGDFDLDDDPKVVPVKPAAVRAPEPERQRVRVAEPEPDPQAEEWGDLRQRMAHDDPAIDPTANIQKLPPHDLDAEAATLSALFLDPAALPMVQDFLKHDHFFSEAHSRIYEASEWCLANGGVIDVIKVGARLKQTERLQQLDGGMAYLAKILNDSPATTNVRHHAAIVYELWRARRAIETARHVLVSGYLGVGDVQAYLDGATQSFGELARKSVGARGMTNGEALRAIIAKLDAPRDNPLGRGIPYGFPTLDKLTGGMHSSETIYVIATTGRGKTTFTTNVALHVAIKCGIGVEVFTTETEKEVWLQNAICALAGVTNMVFQNPDERPPTPEELSRLVAAAGQLADAKWLHIDATNAPSVDYINAVVASRATKTGPKVDGAPLGLVIVDHLHHLKDFLAADDRGKTKAVNDSTKALADSCKRFKLPFLISAQSAKVEADRRTKLLPKPTSGRLSYSSQAENNADKVFVLQHPPLYVRGSMKGEDTSRVWLHPTKGRRMARREIEFLLQGAEGRLVDVEAETNGPAVAASRKQIDLQPEPVAPKVPMTPAAAAAEPEDEPQWFEEPMP